MDFHKMDKRVIERNLENGTVTPKEYKKYFADLKDLENDYEILETDLYDEEEEDKKDGEEVVDPDNIAQESISEGE